ncbi:hypothetical protein L208DRAFT_533805 [Tricholoma matsutake]|nr:hypothetical protein L208DRAFT_533805 [Tricholoma matsutake 945]
MNPLLLVEMHTCSIVLSVMMGIEGGIWWEMPTFSGVPAARGPWHFHKTLMVHINKQNIKLFKCKPFSVSSSRPIYPDCSLQLSSSKKLDSVAPNIELSLSCYLVVVLTWSYPDIAQSRAYIINPGHHISNLTSVSTSPFPSTCGTLAY